MDDATEPLLPVPDRGPRFGWWLVAAAVGGLLLAGAGIFALASLGGDDASKTAATVKPEPSATASPGDAAACVAWARTTKKWTPELKDLHANGGVPVGQYALTYQTVRDAVDDGMAAAGPELRAKVDGVIAALNGAIATADAWTEGTLDLSADLLVVYSASNEVAGACNLVAPESAPFDGLIDP